MKAKISALRVLCLLAASAIAQNPQPSTTLRVPDAATALKIAEPALIKKYGKREIDYEKPLKALLADGVWNVYGTPCCPDHNGQRTCEIGKCFGGGVAAKIRSSDGKMLSISHAK